MCGDFRLSSNSIKRVNVISRSTHYGMLQSLLMHGYIYMLCLLVLTSACYSTRLSRKPILAPTVPLASTKAFSRDHYTGL